ncbi:hypothetical protein VNO77_37742 [Canavalia gladiata]|uniref:Uncharacterized protein n=1 Tax=Canavalia gladiata TaxID=3824 RepID=A0AAN9KCC9_CANGL
MKRKKLHHHLSLGRQSSLVPECDLSTIAQPSEALNPVVRLRCLANEKDWDESKEFLDAGRATLISETSTLHIASVGLTMRESPKCINHRVGGVQGLHWGRTPLSNFDNLHKTF